MKKILLFSSDKDLYSSVEQGLEKTEYKVTLIESLSDAAEHIKQKLSDVLLIDGDSQQISPDEIYKTFKSIAPRLKAIVLVSTKDVSQVVKSIKAGVFDFLSKPVQFKRLKESIENAFISQIPLKNAGGASLEDLWLCGSSSVLLEFISILEESAISEKDAILLSAAGVPRKRAAAILHEKSFNRGRRLSSIDLVDYTKEGSESVFWPTLKELFLINDASKDESPDRAGTVFLDNYDRIPSHFRQLLLEYLSQRKAQNIDKTIKAVLGAEGIPAEEKDKSEKDFDLIFIPCLSERKEDIPALTDSYLKKYSAKYAKKINGFSAEVLNSFMNYEWAGNYAEMENLIENAVLLCAGQYIETADIETDLYMILSGAVKKAMLGGNWKLAGAKEIFEKKLIEALIAGSKGDLDKVSVMLDLPKTNLTERIRRLGIRGIV